ncbi:open rectifier potassium channel protein 1 isoform X2 [Euwallacea fornicatus]
MSKKQWLVLLCLYVMYLLAGAAIFYYVEAKEELKRANIEMKERKNLEIQLKSHFHGNYTERKQLFASLTEYCGKPLDFNMSEKPIHNKWDFYHSLFFVITVVSTIGYGNLAPTTMSTRLFMIFYALVGIPMNGIVIYTLGEFFGKSFTKLHQRWKNSKLEAKFDYYTAKLGLIGQVILYLVPGFTFFIFLPSTIMTVFEGWSYDVSVYYSFVSLTTTGFGDYVAGTSDNYDFGSLYAVYQVFLLVWIIGGMGYVFMILSFITDGMRSKRIKQIEHMLSENIKNTPKKIRGELRTLLQEMLFMRVKPVYKEEFEYVPSIITRSQSCPDLTTYKMRSPNAIRKRAMSECYRAVNIQKVQSDTDLDRIDKERTFMPTSDLFNQTGLLFKVCNALSCESLHHHQQNEGIQGFSDDSILASEYYEPPIKPNKRRAISDIRPPNKLLHEAVNGNTWYGTDAAEALKEYRRRQRAKSVVDYKKPEKENIFRKIRNRLMSRDETHQPDVEKPKTEPKLEPPPSLFVHRESFSPPTQDRILEKTSIADFIRALSVISTAEEDKLIESPPRSRRHGIVVAQSRRSSLAPEFHPHEVGVRRRFSLRPAEETLLANILPTKPKRKVSVSFLDERRNSLLGDPNIPPTLKENTVFSSPPKTQQPPPYSSIQPSTHRQFSVKPVNIASVLASPVQKQLQKRDRTESTSSSNKL